ncbi:MAG: hypothetical protein GKR89_29695 [Candidatus Latescibacteria bacterium]|nr:hypothetical protein [Candidatus Latescibacterota bacterium]
MLTKVTGAFLLVGGLVVGYWTAMPLIGGLVGGVFGLLGGVIQGAVALVLIYGGWRCINGWTPWAKVAGALLLVGGFLLGAASLGGLVIGVLGLIWLAIKGALVAGLIYWGWCWVNGRPVRLPAISRK